MTLDIPIKTVSGLNAREHWRQRAKRVREENLMVRGYLLVHGPSRPQLPCVVKLTRIGPSNGLDPFDNLPSALKGCVDAIAAWLGVDDRKSDLVRYECAQERGPKWLVRVEFSPARQLQK